LKEENIKENIKEESIKEANRASHSYSKGEFRFRPISAFVYILALSQSERVDL
jgi:hypothetical protein